MGDRTLDALKDAELQAARELPDPVQAERNLQGAGITFIEAWDFIQYALPPPNWIVPDFIAVRMKGDLCGGAKSKKTFLARQLAMCIASGSDFVGTYRITTPHKVAYFDLELFDWNSQERLREQSKSLGILWDTFKGNLLISHLRGKASKLRDHASNIISALKARGIEMVIIDPRYKLPKPGEDENTADGLRGILDFRDALSEHFAVLFVIHDPKGNNSRKKATDRGAGSYTGGADFDFRLTIDKAESWTDEQQDYVIESEGRARKPPAPVGVTFDEMAQIFRRDDTVQPVKQDERKGAFCSAQKRAAKEAEMQEAFREAALRVVEAAGPNLISCERFDATVAKQPGGALGCKRRRDLRNVLVSTRTLATSPQLEKKPDGRVCNRKHGKTLISTPERIADYVRSFDA